MPGLALALPRDHARLDGLVDAEDRYPELLAQQTA
jgi:hypothetical protein